MNIIYAGMTGRVMLLNGEDHQPHGDRQQDHRHPPWALPQRPDDGRNKGAYYKEFC